MRTEAIEALSYIENAKAILSEKAQEDNGYYQDKESVRMAGRTAHLGVKVALDAIFRQKKESKKPSGRHQKELSFLDKKVANAFSTAYQILYFDMTCDGATDAELIQIGLKRAEYVINWVNNRLERN